MSRSAKISNIPTKIVRFLLLLMNLLLVNILRSGNETRNSIVSTNMLKVTSIFYHIATTMNFFIWKKYDVLFSRYLDFCVFHESTNFKIFDIVIDRSYTFDYFLKILHSIKIKFGQTIVQLMTDTFNLFFSSI